MGWLKALTHIGLECAEEVAEEGVLDAQGQDLPFDQGALDVVVVQHIRLCLMGLANQWPHLSQIPKHSNMRNYVLKMN